MQYTVLIGRKGQNLHDHLSRHRKSISQNPITLQGKNVNELLIQDYLIKVIYKQCIANISNDERLEINYAYSFY